MRIAPISIPGINENIYAGFWLRLLAFFLDGYFIKELNSFFESFDGYDRYSFVYTTLVTTVLMVIYEVFVVKMFGGTPGKLILGLKIININGQDVGWKESFLRQFVFIAMRFIMIVVMIIIAFNTTDESFFSVAFEERTKFMLKQHPEMNWLVIIIFIWIFSELIVLLTNKRKRSIQDYMANTIVIKSKFQSHIKSNLIFNETTRSSGFVIRKPYKQDM